MKNYRVAEGNTIGRGAPVVEGGTQFALVADTAITKGRLVGLEGSADGAVQHAANNDVAPIGIALADYAIGENPVVETRVLVRVTASGTVTRGSKLGCAADGLVKVYASGASVGTALNAAADGEEVMFVINIQL